MQLAGTQVGGKWEGKALRFLPSASSVRREQAQGAGKRSHLLLAVCRLPIATRHSSTRTQEQASAPLLLCEHLGETWAAVGLQDWADIGLQGSPRATHQALLPAYALLTAYALPLESSLLLERKKKRPGCW